MKNTSSTSKNHDYPLPLEIIAQMIDKMVMGAPQSLTLEALATRAGYDPTHFHKLFTASVGITPKQFQSYLNIRHARDLLNNGSTTERTAEKINLSSSGRLYDLFKIHEAIAPSDVSKRGLGLNIQYGWHATRLGDLLIGTTQNGICYLGFRVEAPDVDAVTRMRAFFPAAAYNENPAHTASIAATIDAHWLTKTPCNLPLDIHGTNFQLQVWQALLRIPDGTFVSYQDVAQAIGRPKASRAVGTAVGSNPISLLIPCHRVIQSSGIVENYGWGTPRKRLLLGVETAK